MKINVNEIEGYADMTVEEKLAALESYDMKPDYTGYIEKKVFDKTASELAAKKKELKAKLSEDELQKQKEAEDRAELEAKYDQLLRESNISKYKAKFLGMGYEENSLNLLLRRWWMAIQIRYSLIRRNILKPLTRRYVLRS